jgi:TP901 family phage tail tape measure protein
VKAFTIPTVFTAIDKFSGPVNKMTDSMDKMERKVRNVGAMSLNVAKKSALVGAAIVAPMAILANEAIKFEDAMADVAKTTGLVGKPLEELSNQLLNLAPSTRTTIEELQKIAGIGGQMGVANKELFGFVESVNMFNVALGSDFNGGVEEATRSISILRNLFKETRDLKVADAITKAGSAINAISAKGVNVPELTDFVSRIGQLPDAIKPTLQATTALGAVMNKAGITSEIAARGVGDVLLIASKNLPAFAKQIGITDEAAKQLINTAPEKFLAQFAASLQGLDVEQLSKKLAALKIGNTGSIKVIGALSSATKQLAEFQSIINNAFAQGTSIIDEYNVKNNTTAAMVAKTKNSFEAFGIILGREILPIVNDLAMKLIPVIKGFSQWAQRNKGALGTIMKLAAATAALSLAISAISTVVFAVTKGILAYNFVVGLMTAANIISSGAIWTNTVAMNGFVFGLKAAKIATAAFNFVLGLNPYIQVAMAILGLSFAVYQLSKSFSFADKTIENGREIRKRAIQNTIDQRVESTLLFQALRKAAIGSKEYNSVLEKIEALQPGIVKQYNLQAGAIDMISKAEKDLTSNIIKRAEAEAKAELLREKMREYLTNEMEWPSYLEKLLSSFGAYGGFVGSKFFEMKQQNLQKEIDNISNATFSEINPQKEQQDSMMQMIQTNKASVDINLNDPQNRLNANTSSPFVQINTTSTMANY